MSYNGTLMSGETPVAEIRQNEIKPINQAMMPIYLAAGGTLEHWLASRAIDRHRPNSRILKKVLRLADTSDVSAVLHAHGATITDNYWLRGEDEPLLTYEQVRFTEDTLSDVALLGSFESFNRNYPSSRTPELTNIGSYEKCWKIEDGIWYLYKQGNALERFTELFISRLGSELGFRMAQYEPAGAFIKTRDFTENKYNFEPAASLVGDNEEYALNYRKLKALHPALAAQYLDILYLDALCFNMDRHTYNYGLLRSRETGEVAAMAPNFDNNIALISRGYGASPSGSNGLLIDLFLELLVQEKIIYSVPEHQEQAAAQIAGSILPDESIRRDYVVQFVMDRSQRLETGILELNTINREIRM